MEEYALVEPSQTAADESVASVSLSPPREELRYGFFKWRPDKLQTINNIQAAVFFLSIAHCIQNATNGLLGVSITTLEKRFNFSSLMSSAIASAYEFGQVPTVLFILAYGHKIHRPIFIGIGMMVVSLGCLFFFIPQFLTPLYVPSFMDSETDSAKVDLCVTSKLEKDQETCPAEEARLSRYLPFFVIGRFLIGIGATPVLTSGITYINDCSNREDFGLYSGIYNAMSIVGPGIGILSSSFLLNVYVDFYRVNVDSLGYDNDDPRWIGNWWLPYIMLCFLALIFAVPLLGFPNDLPGANEIRKGKETEVHTQDKASTKPFSKLTIVKNMKKLFYNPSYILSCVFSICEMFIIIGINSFGPKLFENFLVISPQVAGIAFGLVLLPAGMIGTILGGILIQKFKMTCRQIIRVQTALTIITLLLLPSILMICNPVPFGGATRPSSVFGSNLGLNDDCNEPCMCDRIEYQPVCSTEGVQYFSPCHAGCKDKIFSDEANIYELYNCSCLSVGTSEGPDAYAQPCESKSCKRAIPFLFCFSTIVCLMFTCFTMNISVMLRVVKTPQVTAAVSIQVLLTKLVGTIPAPIILGMIIDMACAMWEENPCNEAERKCVVFLTNKLSMNTLFICFAAKLVACLAAIALNISYKPSKYSKTKAIVLVTPEE